MSFWSLTDPVSVYSHYIGNWFLTEWFFWAICFNELVHLFNCCHNHETNISLLYFHLFICYSRSIIFLYEVVKSAADSSELDHFSLPQKCLMLFYVLIVRQKTTIKIEANHHYPAWEIREVFQESPWFGRPNTDAVLWHIWAPAVRSFKTHSKRVQIRKRVSFQL